MKKVRSHCESQAVELYPTLRACPSCQQPLEERYRKRRWVVTLQGQLRVTTHVLECQTADCLQREVRYRPENERALVLPGYTFGLDVVAHVGQLRYGQQKTITEIARQLGQQGVSISVKEVQLLSEVYLALIEASVADDEQVLAELEKQGGVVLSIDGVQPEKGNETLWLVRDVLSGRVLAARNLLSSASAELESLLDEVIRLGVRICGVVSDKQESLCLAIERKLPGVPHQVCHYHYLRDVALPVCEADRGLKKRVKHKLREVREIEVKWANKGSPEAQVVSDYCLAVRTVMSDDGKYPLEPAGITLYDRVLQIKHSVESSLRTHASATLERLGTILSGVVAFAGEYGRLVVAWSWIACLAQRLETAGSRQQASEQMLACGRGLPRDSDEQLKEIASHIEKLTTAFAPRLFAYMDEPLLPKTNNDLEVFIGQVKKDRRRVTGRKNTTAFILREGRAVATLLSLPSRSNWIEAFAAVDLKHFAERLAKLRRREERSKVWRIKRSLEVYLNRLELSWQSLE
jgi:hypothetical protein